MTIKRLLRELARRTVEAEGGGTEAIMISALGDS